MTTRILFLALWALLSLSGSLVAAVSTDSSSRPAMTAIHTTGEIHVDGRLDEPEWQRPGISDFTQRDPVEGAAPTQKTEAWIAYDDAAIYIAARMFDSPDSIVK